MIYFNETNLINILDQSYFQALHRHKIINNKAENSEHKLTGESKCDFYLDAIDACSAVVFLYLHINFCVPNKAKQKHTINIYLTSEMSGHIFQFNVFIYFYYFLHYRAMLMALILQ